MQRVGPQSAPSTDASATPRKFNFKSFYVFYVPIVNSMIIFGHEFVFCFYCPSRPAACSFGTERKRQMNLFDEWSTGVSYCLMAKVSHLILTTPNKDTDATLARVTRNTFWKQEPDTIIATTYKKLQHNLDSLLHFTETLLICWTVL